MFILRKHISKHYKNIYITFSLFSHKVDYIMSICKNTFSNTFIHLYHLYIYRPSKLSKHFKILLRFMKSFTIIKTVLK